MTSAAGYTIAELLVATSITLTITAAVFELIRHAQGTFEAQPEISDMHQRLRVGIDAITADLLMAGAGLAPEMFPAVMPYRADGDPAAGVFYRPDTVTVLYVPWAETTIVSHTYSLKRDAAADTSHLMHSEGAADFPVVDHVATLEFEYFDTEDAPLDPAMLQDGPWVPDDPAVLAFDADLLRIRRVRVVLRIEAGLASMRGPSGSLFARGGTSTAMERYVPDREVRFDVAVRNMNRDR